MVMAMTTPNSSNLWLWRVQATRDVVNIHSCVTWMRGSLCGVVSVHHDVTVRRKSEGDGDARFMRLSF